MGKKPEEQQDLLGDSSFSDELLNHLDDIPDEVKKKWPEALVTLIDIYYSSLSRMGMDEAIAQQIAHALLAEQAAYCGGRYFYLPKGDVLKRAIRDADLYRDSQRGVLPNNLAQRYGISVTHVYRIISEQHAIRRRQLQPDLF